MENIKNNEDIVLEKNVNNVLISYKEFLKNYKKLNEYFELSNPIEIMELFYHLYMNGYLSLDKDFDYFDGDGLCFDYDDILGANILNGVGCCRHIASLLNDIYNICNMNAYIHSVSVPSNCSYTKVINGKSQSYKEKFEIIQAFMTNGDVKRTKEKIKNYKSMYLDVTFDYTDNGYSGNHVINVVSFNNKAYIIDGTNHCVPNYNRKDGIYSFAGIPFYPKFDDFFFHYFKLSIKEILKEKSPTITEVRNCMERAKNLFLDNRSIFEKFYNDNSDLYQETNEKSMILMNIHKG